MLDRVDTHAMKNLLLRKARDRKTEGGGFTHASL